LTPGRQTPKEKPEKSRKRTASPSSSDNSVPDPKSMNPGRNKNEGIDFNAVVDDLSLVSKLLANHLITNKGDLNVQNNPSASSVTPLGIKRLSPVKEPVEESLIAVMGRVTEKLSNTDINTIGDLCNTLGFKLDTFAKIGWGEAKDLIEYQSLLDLLEFLYKLYRQSPESQFQKTLITDLGVNGRDVLPIQRYLLTLFKAEE